MERLEWTGEKYRSVLIFGPPGSGKGTIGRFLSSAGNHYHLSSGEIIRGLSVESSVGRRFHTVAKEGKLIPDDLMVDVWLSYVLGLVATNRYYPHEQLLLLDGIPRTLSQAQLMERYIEVGAIILLEVKSQETLITRLQKRGLAEKREDDSNLEVLRTRLKIYEQQTADVLSHYPGSIVYRFDADQKPLCVLKDVLNLLVKEL